MKTRLLFLAVALGAGCHAVPPQKPAAPVVANDDAAKLAEARRFIAALTEENDVLREQLKVAETPNLHVLAASVPVTPPAEAPMPVAAPREREPLPDLPLVVPNAEGLIDLAGLAHPAEAPVNPFTVRAGPSDPKKELNLLVQGTCTGPEPVALINDRVYHEGEAVETLQLERIDPEAVTLRWEGHRLKLAAAEKPARVRLP